MRRSTYIFTKLTSTVFLLFLLAGCTNLEAVRNFSELSKVASAKFPSMANDFYETCVRRQVYMTSSTDVFDGASCHDRDKARKGLLSVYTILEDYLKTMGALAKNSIIDTKKSYDALGKAIEKSKKFSAEEISAAGTVATYLTNMVVGMCREAELKKMINSNNDAIKVIVKSLDEVGVEAYQVAINLEVAAMRGHYTDEIMRSKRLNANEPLAIVLAKEKSAFLANQINSRKKSIDALRGVLRKIGEGHQELYDGKHDLSSKELVSKLFSHVKEMNSLRKKISAAF